MMNDTKEWIALNLSLILDKSQLEIVSHLSRKDIKIFDKYFFCVEDSFLEKRFRAGLQRCLNHMSFKNKWLVTGCLKRLRSAGHKKPLFPSQCAGTKVVLDIAKRANAAIRPWDGRKSAVCITHDVDTPECYAFIPALVKAEKQYNIRSTFNFLTEGGYKIDKQLLLFLTSNDFEVGLHGATHNAAFGYLEEGKIEEALASAVKAGGFNAFGFRSPALSIGPQLIRALIKCGARYDSTVSLFYKGRGSCFPYLFPDSRLWELPLCLQDDVLFRDMNLKQEEAFELVVEYINDVKKIGGVCALNFHPILVKHHLEFYDKLMEYLFEQKDLWIGKSGDLMALMDKRLCER